MAAIPHAPQTIPVHTSSINQTPTNASLNLSVLQRHNPSVREILSIAPYAVIYTFNPILQSWEKSGTEGTLFVCSLICSPPEFEVGLERYAVIVLNRRGLENFDLELTSEDDVEITPEYVILQKRDNSIDGEGHGERDPTVYGLWIFAEPMPGSTAQMRELNASLIQDCALRAAASRRAALEDYRRARQGTASREQSHQQSSESHGQGYQPQRETAGQEAYWNYQPQSTGLQGNMNTEYGSNVGGDVLGNLFRRARQGYSSTG